MLLNLKRPVYTDGVIDLVSLPSYQAHPVLGFGKCYEFMICPHGRRKDAGRISLRMGQSEAIYYYGHIGYHVNPPWRGNGWAQRACRLVRNLMRLEGHDSVVITCDPDNIASRKTCEHLGCILQRTVPVAEWLQERYDISPVKCRYIWRLDPDHQSGGETP